MKKKATVWAKFINIPEHQKPMLFLLMAGVGLLCLTILVKGTQALFKHHKPPVEPVMVRQDDHIMIPLHSPLRQQIKVKAVQLSSQPHMLSFPSVIEAIPNHQLDVFPPIAGRLTSLNVNLGDFVQKEQIIATIDSPDLAQAHANYDKAKSTLTLTTAALERAKNVFRAGGNAFKMVQLAENEHIQAQAEVARALATLKALQSRSNQFSVLTIKAPIAGRVTAINYGEHAYINNLQTPLISLTDLTTIWVTANIPENTIGLIKPSQPVDVHLEAYPDQLLHTKVSFVDAILDPDTRRNKTRMTLSNPQGTLQPNMFAIVDLALPEPKHIMIPTTAIFMNDDTTSVYVEIKPWVFERREVQLGTEDHKNVRVLTGLKPGERIATCGGIFIND